MADLNYEKTPVLSHAELVREIDSGDPERMSTALYSATRHDEDWQWVQEQCLQHLTHSAVPVRWAAATCLGDLAFFFHRPIDHVRVLTALYEAANDPAVADPVHFSISLINQKFTPQ